MKTADLYIRVAARPQLEVNPAQNRQEIALRAYCKKNKIAIRNVVYENHSAINFKRPGGRHC